jgi:hypothetical protein
VEVPALGHAGEHEVEQELAIGGAEDVASKLGEHVVSQGLAVFEESLYVAVVGEDPGAELKGVRVERRELALRGLSDVGEDGLGGDHAGDPMKEGIRERGRGALDEVRRPPDVVGDAPAIRVLSALDGQRILGRHQAVVDLALNDGAESEESTHGVEV